MCVAISPLHLAPLTPWQDQVLGEDGERYGEMEMEGEEEEGVKGKG